MENRLPSLLHNTFTRYRLTCTVAISLAVHLLVWGAVVWSGVLNPNIILAEKLDQKHKLVTCKLWDRLMLDEPGVKLTGDGKRRTTSPNWVE